MSRLPSSLAFEETEQSRIFPNAPLGYWKVVVRKLLAHAGQHGAGARYLIQHSAGSGKSNSITTG